MKLQEKMEDIEDRKDIEHYMKNFSEGQEEIIPGEVTFAILGGVHPVKAWRECRGIKLKELSEKIGKTGAYISQIESGKRNPTIDTLKKIAKALDLEVEMLI